jgi:hypothetical protein
LFRQDRCHDRDKKQGRPTHSHCYGHRE